MHVDKLYVHIIQSSQQFESAKPKGCRFILGIKTQIYLGFISAKTLPKIKTSTICITCMKFKIDVKHHRHHHHNLVEFLSSRLCQRLGPL